MKNASAWLHEQMHVSGPERSTETTKPNLSKLPSFFPWDLGTAHLKEKEEHVLS
jgi:hypothetical protein